MSSSGQGPVPVNTSFSTQLTSANGLAPLQLAIDSTSLGQFKTCPRLYYYSIVLGFQPRSESVHLIFGLLMHSGVERYHHGRSHGLSHADALDRALDWALRETWNRALSRPWDSGDSYKNRFTLIRTLVGYLDRYEHDTLETVQLVSGKPAVELSFSFQPGFRSRLTGEPFVFCGHLDRLVTLNGDAYISDTKTTKSELSARYWSSHNPSNQFSMYLLAGQLVYQQPVRGLIVDAAQVLVSESRFDRHLITKDDAQVAEFLHATGQWLASMEDCADEGAARASQGEDPAQAWPMNETSCSKYAGCEFQGICSRSPASRRQWLETGFRRRVWDPLQRRGDI